MSQSVLGAASQSTFAPQNNSLVSVGPTAGYSNAYKKISARKLTQFKRPHLKLAERFRVSVTDGYVSLGLA